MSLPTLADLEDPNRNQTVVGLSLVAVALFRIADALEKGASIPRLVKPPAAAKPPKAPAVFAHPPSSRVAAILTALANCVRVKVADPRSAAEAWSKAYPDVDIAVAVLKCEAWAVSKGTTRSPKGWQQTLNTWLRKDQDRARPGPGKGPEISDHYKRAQAAQQEEVHG